MNNSRGILLVLFSMAAFAVEDAFVKGLTSSLPIGQVLLTLGLGGALIFAAIAGPAGWRRFVTVLRIREVALRTLAEALSAVTFITALSLVPLSTVAAVFQATPLAVTAGAAIVFGETVGWRRWSAVAVGFLGVLMILRPGLEGFRPQAMLVLITVATIALRDLITRRIPADVSSLAVSFHGFFAIALSGVAMLVFGPGPVAPEPAQWIWIALAILAGTTGYYAIVAAMRLADASALMPFRYARLVFSLMIGVSFFGERPDAMTLAGAGLIFLAGFYTYLRERRQTQSVRPA